METNEQMPKPENGKGKNIVVAILIVLILAGLGWFYRHKEVKEYSLEIKGNAVNRNFSLKELAEKGSQKCEFVYNNENTSSQSQVYIGNGKMRADVITNTNGKTQTTHVINDGLNQYIWVEGSNQMAIKMSLEQNTNNQKLPDQNTMSTIDINAKREYNCSNWNEDQSMFILPSGIKFTDYSAIMNSYKANTQVKTSTGSQTTAPAESPSSGTNKSVQCLACENLSGNVKAECRAALSCP
jgi:hypothetical protein